MSIQLYKILHFTGLALAFMGLTGVLGLSSNAAESAGKRIFFMLTHGLGMVLTLITGFGLCAKLGYTKSLPYWAIGLIVVWVLTGASYMLVKRCSRQSGLIMIWLTVLLLLGSWLAVMKPF